MNETIEADVDARNTECGCCGEPMDRKGSRLCQACETEGCDPSTGLCLQDLATDGGFDPEEATDADLIGAAIEDHGVDLDRAVCATDRDPDSSRIYIIEELPDRDAYRLIQHGLDGSGNFIEPEDPMLIPESAVGALQGLLHAAGMHATNRGLLTGGDEPNISLRELSEGMGVAEPLPDGGDRDGR